MTSFPGSLELFRTPILWSSIPYLAATSRHPPKLYRLFSSSEAILSLVLMSTSAKSLGPEKENKCVNHINNKKRTHTALLPVSSTVPYNIGIRK